MEEADEDVHTEEVESDDAGVTSGRTRGLRQEPTATDRPRKRRKVTADEDLESSYLNRLLREEEKEAKQSQEKRPKQARAQGSEAEDGSISDDDNAEDPGLDEEDVGILRHEALDGTDGVAAEDKAKRTVFLSNVSTEVIKSKGDKKTLIHHLEGFIKPGNDDKPIGKFESIRFRSTAYVSDAGPKKAAYAKKELMEQTTKSTNAYAVFTTEAAAKKVATRSNGTIVLDRHLRADYLAKPAEVDHKRCIFVGNLSFVDQETGENIDEDGKERRPKAKVPADVEEGLWRTFGKAGKVESVRVIRDKETRVSKGFAYVQFVDQNGVEAALLYNDKKFPPMLPRKLRVMRARRTKQRPAEGRSNPRPDNRGGKFDAKRSKRRTSGGVGGQKASGVVFEGYRASSTNRNPLKRHAKKPKTRSSRRGAAFKAGGGKRKHEA